MTDTKSFTASTHMDQALAGFGAGLISTTILHPLDVIKIRFQVDAAKHSTKRPLIGGTIKSFRDIIQHEGVFRGLYRGVSPSVAGATASWGFYFWWYSLIKKQMKKDDQGKLAAWQHLLASAEAGAITAIMTNPLWVIKTRMCTTTRYTADAYTGLWNGLNRLAKEEGIRGLYRGMVPALFGVSHGAIQFMAYEEMKKWRNDLRQAQGDIPKDELNAKLSTMEYLIMAVSSKTTAAVVTYPYQVLRSRLQNRETKDEYRGVMDCIKKIKSAEGYVGFYKGLAPSIIRVLPGTCITFLVYENMTQYFKNHAS
ncbi:flavin-adenine dinucleotide transporter [Halteromyces radiatus]|uniref:flavin-adenine dinucleotide transporter n=1 Tax=Halteromyces radiatus TaxID=101107 RepID=UPI00221E64EC|nr:flavin-adenine dinucleotide transporter [Halteromyces radiatus]KAI8085000.1 flavin-adenine dinucleotide transporter [Halteromyces radiatus]